jgi:dihydrofolate reductase
MELIAALTNNYVIGSGGDMPWHLPADLAHFKQITTGNTIVMGRKTWQSIGKALPNRTNVVLSKQGGLVASGATVIRSINELVSIDTVGTIFIIGGGSLYQQTIELADKMHLTRIHADLNGDTYFPKFDEEDWNCVDSVFRPKDDDNQHDMTFETWSKTQ